MIAVQQTTSRLDLNRLQAQSCATRFHAAQATRSRLKWPCDLESSHSQHDTKLRSLWRFCTATDFISDQIELSDCSTLAHRLYICYKAAKVLQSVNVVDSIIQLHYSLLRSMTTRPFNFMASIAWNVSVNLDMGSTVKCVLTTPLAAIAIVSRASFLLPTALPTILNSCASIVAGSAPPIGCGSPSGTPTQTKVPPNLKNLSA